MNYKVNYAMKFYIDFKSAESYLALLPTQKCASHYAVEIDYLPFRSAHQAVPPLPDAPNKGETHRHVRALSRRRLQLKYANIQGRIMQFRDTDTDTDLALAALLYIKDDHPEAYIEAAFQTYWQSADDLNDEVIIRQLLSQHHYNAAGFDAALWRAKLDECMSQSIEDGIFETPSYLIGEHLFLGREHLPWVAELLSGTQ